MSYQAVNAALNKAKVTGVQMLVLICMAEDSRDSKTCRTGPDRIALRSGASLRSVRYAISELVASGHLSMVAKGGGRNRPSVYALTFMEMADKDGLRHTAPVEMDAVNSANPATNSATAALFDECRDAETVQSAHETVQSATLNSATIAPKPVGAGIEPVTPLTPKGERSVDGEESKEAPVSKQADLDEAIRVWDLIAGDRNWSPATIQRSGKEWISRRKNILSLLSDHGIDGWKKALRAAARNDHANGKSSSVWFLKFSTFIRPGYFQDRLDEGDSAPKRPGQVGAMRTNMAPPTDAFIAFRDARKAQEEAAKQAATFPQHIH